MSEPLSQKILASIDFVDLSPVLARHPSGSPLRELLVHLHSFACNVERSQGTPDDRLSLVRSSMAAAELYRALSENPQTAHVIDIALWTGRESRA